MKLYWREVRRGQRLVIGEDNGDTENEQEIGGVRSNQGAFDAFAKTFGYEPGRAEKGIPSMEQAKEFVESFRPWELYQGTEGLDVEPDLRPLNPS